MLTDSQIQIEIRSCARVVHPNFIEFGPTRLVFVIATTPRFRAFSRFFGGGNYCQKNELGFKASFNRITIAGLASAEVGEWSK